MTPFDPGDVVLVRFPFTDLTTIKKRPAVIISPRDFAQRHKDVVLIALTSRPQPDGDSALTDWRAAGLPKETWFKPLIGTIAASLVERRLGKLSPADLAGVSSMLRRLIAPIFTS